MIEAIKQLREKTNVGILDCKKTLKEASGDFNKALEVLRKKGVSLARKKSSRAAKQGKIESYIHMEGKIGVLVEINCETDFVAKNNDFKVFCKDIAMQIAAAIPHYIKTEDVPADVIESEKKIIKSQIKGKPENVVEKITEGKLEKFYQDVCLLEQPFIKDPQIKVKDLLVALIGKIGENILIKRFTRYQLGEEK